MSDGAAAAADADRERWLHHLRHMRPVELAWLRGAVADEIEQRIAGHENELKQLRQLAHQPGK